MFSFGSCFCHFPLLHLFFYDIYYFIHSCWFSEDTQRQNSKNRFLPLSESVTACASHPLNATIIAGTTVIHIYFKYLIY